MSKPTIPPGPYDLSARMSAPRRGQPAVVPVVCYERERNRAVAAEQRIAGLEADLAAAKEREAALAKLLEWVVGDHNAPSDCFSTGPMTGTPKDDLCPACAAVQYLESNKLSNAILARDREKDELITALEAQNG